MIGSDGSDCNCSHLHSVFWKSVLKTGGPVFCPSNGPCLLCFNTFFSGLTTGWRQCDNPRVQSTRWGEEWKFEHQIQMMIKRMMLSVKRSTHTKQLNPRRWWQTWCVTAVADTKSNWGRVKQLGRMYNLCLHSLQTKHHQAPLTCDFERNMGKFVGWNTALGFWLYLNNKTAPSVGNDYVFLLVILLCPL